MDRPAGINPHYCEVEEFMPKKTRPETPYKASWIDHFFDWVDRLPVPRLVFYIGLFTFSVLAHHVLLWIDGTLPFGQFEISFVPYLFWLYTYVAAYHSMRVFAGGAIVRIRPALALGEREFNTLRVQFLTLSSRTGWLSITFTTLLTLTSVDYFKGFMGPFLFSPYGMVLTLFELLFLEPIAGAFFYWIFRSLGGISRIYTLVKRVNLFNLTPLYSLAGFSSRLGMVFILFILLSFVTSLPLFSGGQSTAFTDSSITISYMVFFSLIAIVVFIQPLLGIHSRLVKEKEKVSSENNQRMNEAFRELEQRIDKRRLKNIGEFQTSITALMNYRAEIKKIPTWPWDAGTLRGFITALAVPMTVWIVQQVLMRTVGQ